MKTLKYLSFALAFALAFAPSPAQAQAVKPAAVTAKGKAVYATCNLGTAWAVNKNRPVAPDEKPVRFEGGVARVAQLKNPGSSEVVYKMCYIPPGTEGYCSFRGCWIKVCGNDADDPQGWKFPIELPAGQMGPQGPQGIQGLTGPQGAQGSKGDQGVQGPAGADGKSFSIDLWPCNNAGWWSAIGCIVVAGVIGEEVSRHNNWWQGSPRTKGGLPGIKTDSAVVTTKCVATTYPNNCPPSGNRLPGFRLLSFR